MLDFRHANSLWATVAVETLVRLGLRTAVISPGSRSTPLTLAFVNHPRVEAISVLDERSASFFALGRAKATGIATALICTSGTAGANYFPAVIEAWESRVPLVVLTADRPPELRQCSSGQTIDQQKLFGGYVQGYAELGLPEANLSALGYLRQTLSQIWRQAHQPAPGPVHLNCPFRDPLTPPITADLDPALEAQWDATFFDHLYPPAPVQRNLQDLPPNFAATERGVIIVGPTQSTDPIADCKAVAALAKTLGWPVLAEGLSPLRNHGGLNPGLISTYATLLRQPQLAKTLAPAQVLQLGPLPTSKVLRQWLVETDPMRWIIGLGDRNGDPLHGRTQHLGDISLQSLTELLSQQAQFTERSQPSSYWQTWLEKDTISRQRLDHALNALDEPFAGKIPWLMGQMLPQNTPVFIANSTPVRDVEWFWPVSDRGIQPYFNRGANGIDGTLSTALGMAHGGQSSVLLTGDLALLHDSNGFLIRPQLRGHLTIVLINNQGGGIFELLPISQFEPPFEDFFATPQAVSFEALCAAHGVSYELIQTWEQLAQRLSQLPEQGIRLLEVRSDRKYDAQQRLALLNGER
ncbi:MAG: 2-succinyl-5-enolpyruvyl-6-hydroxy-3-cyclohexene-1-carboxylic-acid synthase [Leptolyngbyaceae cyanobacterium]